MHTKSIEWAYPTSDYANRFGFPTSGCWVVETQFHPVDDKPPAGLAGFNQKADAIRWAEEHLANIPWSRYSQHGTEAVPGSRILT
jgi:hypothetical protein